MNLTAQQISTLAKNPLFKGFAPADIGKALYCLRGQTVSFEANVFLFHEGDLAKRMGILLSGHIDLIRYDEEGNTSILESFQSGDSFGEVYAIEENSVYGVSALTQEAGSLLWLEISPLYSDLGCPFGQRLFKNLVSDLAEKDRLLKTKVMILSQKGLANKVLMLLASYEPKEGGWFELPFTREEMANYLACERSALSRLLSQMANERKLSYSGNRFRLR